MEIWNIWTALIEYCVVILSSQAGMSEAISIITFTLIARITLLPISLKSAYNIYKNKLAMNELTPEIELLKERYKKNPREIFKKIMSLYKEKGIKFMDKASVLNIGSQGIVGLGIFQVLKGMTFNSKFMWIANIAKPDVALAFFVGVITFLSMAMMPGAAEQGAWLFFAVPALITIFVLVGFPSAIGIYWATSNAVTVGQSIILRYIISAEGNSVSKI